MHFLSSDTYTRILSCSQKAQIINRREDIYGTFAEIGAGQETVRHFFRVGGASKTIAKALSAYDKIMSDSIYGKEKDGRYVSCPRLQHMLGHEWNLLKERLGYQNKCFFVYANTIATTNPYKYHPNQQGRGWIGIRFRGNNPDDIGEVLLHISLNETDTLQQQETVGRIGVNLIYAAYFHNENIQSFIHSIYDNLNKWKFSIDVLNFSGTPFKNIDNRIVSLFLVRNGYTRSVCFGPHTQNVLLADLLYKKNILLIRGTYRPVTKTNIEIAEKSATLLSSQYALHQDNILPLFELTLQNLEADAFCNERDFLDRAELLRALGKFVLITHYASFHETLLYLSHFTTEKLSVAMGLPFWQHLFSADFYTHLDGGITEAIGVIEKLGVNIYVYPGKNKETQQIQFLKDLILTDKQRALLQLISPQIQEIKDYTPALLDIHSGEVIEKIRCGDTKWKNMVPEQIISFIEKQQCFLPSS